MCFMLVSTGIWKLGGQASLIGYLIYLIMDAIGKTEEMVSHRVKKFLPAVIIP
jgi:hypothetical protein